MTTLDSEFDRRLRALLTGAQEAGFAPQVASGYRSAEDQARAIDSVSRNVLGRPASVIEYSRGIPGYAAPVGGSMHQKGLAADLTGTGLDWLRQNAPAYGVRFPESLARSDPNHAEVDPQFWGPVQDPRDRAAVIAARGETAQAPAEVPASKGGIGPNAVAANTRAPAPAPVAPQVASFVARAPQAVPQQDPGLWGNLAKFVTNTVQNPLFNAGMGMVAAGAKGLGVGGGFLSAGEAMAQANQRQAEARRQQTELDQQQNRALLWNDMMTNPNPAWAKDLPAGTVDLARALGPDAGSKLAIDLVTKHASGWLERAKLEEEKRNNDIKATLAEAQLNESRATNEDRRLTQETIRRQRQQEMEMAQREAEVEAEITGAPPPAPVQPAPTRPPVQPFVNPNIRRQSNEAPGEDPMLIPTQSTSVPGIAQQGPREQPTVRIQRGGREVEVSPDEARTYAQKLLALPKFKALGQEIIKRADAAEKQTALATPLRNEIDKKEFEISENFARLQRIGTMFKPEYQELESKIGFSWAATVDKSTTLQRFFGKLKPEQKQQLEDYAAYRADAFDTLNEYIRSVTGAAMTNAEAERITKGIINPGASWWEGDSPAEFKAKLDNAMKNSRLAMVRMSYAKAAGRPWNTIPLTEMRRIIDNRGDTLASEFGRQGLKPEEIQQRVRTQLRTEFGGNI